MELVNQYIYSQRNKERKNIFSAEKIRKYLMKGIFLPHRKSRRKVSREGKRLLAEKKESTLRLAIESITYQKIEQALSSYSLRTVWMWYNSETNKEDLVQGGACGGEGAGCVCQDPAHLLCHPDVRLSTSTSTPTTTSIWVTLHCNNLHPLFEILSTWQKHWGRSRWHS